MASQVRDTAWLEWIAGLMGVGSRQTLTAALPPGRFHCLLDELPLHLIPRRQVESRRGLDSAQLVFNPQCSVLFSGQLPAELEAHRGLLENFHLQGTIAWVRDPATGALCPFWLGARLEKVVARLRSGQLLPESLRADVRELLEGAGIVTTPDHTERRLAEWAEVVGKSSKEFREK